jgi:hypothetical protein
MSMILICANTKCGQGFQAKKYQAFARCPACRKQARLDNAMRYRANLKKGCGEPLPLKVAIERKVTGLTVVLDPLEPGGFAPGTVFDKTGWHEMYARFAFTPGTILRDVAGRLYKFEDKEAVYVDR